MAPEAVDRVRQGFEDEAPFLRQEDQIEAPQIQDAILGPRRAFNDLDNLTGAFTINHQTFTKDSIREASFLTAEHLQEVVHDATRRNAERFHMGRLPRHRDAPVLLVGFPKHDVVARSWHSQFEPLVSVVMSPNQLARAAMAGRELIPGAAVLGNVLRVVV